MKSPFFFLIILMSFGFEGYGQWHSPVLPNLDGQELLSALVDDFKTTTVLSYADARDVMYLEIDNKNNQVSCIYTEHSIFLSPTDPSPRETLYMNGMDDGINTEHSYPRSKGADNGNPKSDIHHLYPARVIVNTKRSTKPYAEIPDNNTDEWFYLNQTQAFIPTSNIDKYSESDPNDFEPRESVKGNIARSMMYFYTMYKSEADAQDPQYFWDQLDDLCQWHYNDPVDQEEYERTLAIASYQDGKANPFVLDCSVAGRTYCDMITDLCNQTVPSKEINVIPDFDIYPNPNLGDIRIAFANAKQSINIDLINVYGQIVESHFFRNKKEVHFQTSVKPGYYFININIEGDIGLKPIVITQ